MHIDDYGRVGTDGDGPWERNHPSLFDYGVDAENLIIPWPDLNRWLQKQEPRQDECCFSPLCSLKAISSLRKCQKGIEKTSMLLWSTDGSLEEDVNCRIDIADYLQVNSKLIRKIKTTKYKGDLLTKSLKCLYGHQAFFSFGISIMC